MRKMKNSGVEWIGIIPETWSVKAGKHYLTLLNRKPTIEDQIITCFRDGEVTLRSNRREDGFTFSEKEIGYQGIKKGDLVVHGMDGFAGAIGISDSDGKGTPILNVLESSQSKKYLMYFLRSAAMKGYFLATATGIRVRSCDLRWSKLASMPLLLPPIPEQNAIATYLDSKCSQIDFIVEKTRQEIEKLKEYRQSMITEAVTKGLDPDVEMKDSGVEWIGKIPSSWKIGRVKNILDYADKYPIGDGDHGLIKPTDYKDSGIPYIRVQNLTWEGTLDLSKVVYISSETNQKIRGSQLKPNDILIAKTGATIGKVGIIPNDMPISNTTSHVGKITISKKHNPSFLLYVLSSNLVREQLKEISAMQSTRPELGISNMKNLVITIPSRDVQDEIAITLSRKTAQIDLAVRKQYQLIDKLQEYKKSLIYECVTGKKEVASNARSV